MENVKYYFRGHARSDIAKIRRYTIKQWGEEQWENYKKALFKKFQSLANNPSIGMAIDEISPNAFRFPIENHVVYYLKRDDKVIFVGVISSEMSPKKHLQRKRDLSAEISSP